MNPVEVTGLRKTFISGPVLNGLELNVPEQSIYGLLGRNGAGKSTLLRCVMGLVRANAGEARILGANLAKGCPPEKAQVAYVAQGEFLPSWARISDLIQFESALRPLWDATSLEAWMKTERLVASRRVKEMSVGQRKRLELELALAARPKVMLMDEPFAGLDPVSRAEFTEQVLAHAAEHGVTIVLSSHILSDLERLCDRIGVLAQGVIAFESELDDLKEGGAIVTATGQDVPQLTGGAHRVAARGSHGDSTWVVSGLSDEEAAALGSSGFQISRGSLEELGVELIRCLDAR